LNEEKRPEGDVLEEVFFMVSGISSTNSFSERNIVHPAAMMQGNSRQRRGTASRSRTRPDQLCSCSHLSGTGRGRICHNVISPGSGLPAPAIVLPSGQNPDFPRPNLLGQEVLHEPDSRHIRPGMAAENNRAAIGMETHGIHLEVHPAELLRLPAFGGNAPQFMTPVPREEDMLSIGSPDRIIPVPSPLLPCA